MDPKPSFQLLRIAAFIAVIFASGILIGRVTAPTSHPTPISAVSRGTFDQPGSIVERSVEWMKRRFELSEEQEREFRTLMKEMEDKMLKHKSASRERFEIYQQFSPRIREFVPEDLKDVYDAGRRRIERRYRRAINRAASESNG